jgi:hypothetical protein
MTITLRLAGTWSVLLLLSVGDSVDWLHLLRRVPFQVTCPLLCREKLILQLPRDVKICRFHVALRDRFFKAEDSRGTIGWWTLFVISYPRNLDVQQKDGL